MAGAMVIRAIPIIVLVVTLGCASLPSHISLVHSAFVHHAQTQAKGDLTVRVGVPSYLEAREMFGFDLEAKGIRPIWLQVENSSNHPFWFSMPSFDPDYYSPLEAAFLFHGWFPPSNKAIDAHFKKLSFGNPIPARTTVSGFVFGNLINGPEVFNADFFAVNHVERFSFQLSLADLDTDAACFNPSMVYPDHEVRDCKSSEELREAIKRLPCCTTNETNQKMGDPLNVAMVGKLPTILSAMAIRGWHETDFIRPQSVWDTLKSYLFGIRYPHSPISALYFQGRVQDIALQKVRGDVQQRIHMRLWLTPLRFQDNPVFIGQVSRDVGVKFWASRQGITTHVIDPDVDEARASLASDLTYSQALAKIGYVSITGFDKPRNDRSNLSEDEYFTDGLRVVLFFSEHPVRYEEIEVLSWEAPPWDRRANTRSHQVKD